MDTWNTLESFFLIESSNRVTRVNETNMCVCVHVCAKEKKKKRWKWGNYVFDRHVRIYEPEAGKIHRSEQEESASKFRFRGAEKFGVVI